MALTTITQGNTADLTVVNNGYSLYVNTTPGGSAKVTIVSGLSGFIGTEFSGQRLFAFPASGVVRVTAVSGSAAYELGTGASLGTIAIGSQPEDVLTTKQIAATVAGTPITLTGPTIQATNSINNYTQVSIVNKSSGVNSSADHIAYPDNGTDVAGWIDSGITSSGFSQAIYAVTGPNEGYVFMSSPTNSTTGNLIIATDSTGSQNDIIFATRGFENVSHKKVWITGNVTGTTEALGFGIGARAAANAALSITSTTQGVQLPVMTTTQKNAIAAPTAGLLVYDSTLNKLCIRVAAAWETVTSV